MLIRSRIELSLKIEDIGEIYSKNRDDMLLRHARLIYEKKCMYSSYIHSINSIIKRSQATIIKRDLTECAIRVYVTFDVTIIKYDQHDIIVGCKVIKDSIQKGTINYQNMILCKNDHVTAMINNSDKLSSIQKDQIIPVIVGGISYSDHKNTILVNAYPFIPVIGEEVVYKIDPLSEENKQYLRDTVYSQLDKVLEEKKSIIQDLQKKKRWTYFVDLLYPYKNKKAPFPKTVSHRIVSIMDMEQSGYVLQTSKHSMETLEFIVLEKEPDQYVVEKSINVYEIFIMNALKYIDTINKLTICYEQNSVFKSHQNIFKIYSDNKYE